VGPYRYNTLSGKTSKTVSERKKMQQKKDSGEMGSKQRIYQEGKQYVVGYCREELGCDAIKEKRGHSRGRNIRGGRQSGTDPKKRWKEDALCREQALKGKDKGCDEEEGGVNSVWAKRRRARNRGKRRRTWGGKKKIIFS